MHSVQIDFPLLRSVKIIVEERRIDLDLDPKNWRTHVYTGLQDLPNYIAPTFASPGSSADLDLTTLIRAACSTGNVETRFEMPYADGEGPSKKTILRSVVVYLYYTANVPAHVRPVAVRV